MRPSRIKTLFRCGVGKIGVEEVQGAVSMFIAGLRSDGVAADPLEGVEVRIRPEEAQKGLLTAWQAVSTGHTLVFDDRVGVGRFHCELAQAQD